MNKIISIPSLFAIVLLLLSAQLMFAGNWSKAPASPPNNNTDTPINVGSKTQDKQGALGVNALAVFGLSQISSNMPRLVFNETDAQDWELRVSNNTFNLMHDFDASGAFEWVADGPWPMTFQGDGEFVRFRNQVRANEYCDSSGENCFIPVSLPKCAKNQILVSNGNGWVCENNTPPALSTNECDVNFSVRFAYTPIEVTTVRMTQGTVAGMGIWFANPGIVDGGFTEELKTATWGGGTFSHTWSMGVGYYSDSADMVYTGNPTVSAFNVEPGEIRTLSRSNTSITAYVDNCEGTPYTPLEAVWVAGTVCGTSPTCELTNGFQVEESSCDPSTKLPSEPACVVIPEGEGTCFTADTLVTMTDGSEKQIKDVTIGEQVLGTDGSVNTVLGYDRPMLGERLLYSFNGGEYFVTAEHPFLTTEGWKSISVPALIDEDAALAEELQVTTLEAGDEIVKADGTIEVIESIRSKKAEDQQLYNLQLDGNNTYHADGYVTHNKGWGG